MTRMFVIGEDSLCCALGERLIIEIMGWQLAQPAVNTRGVSKLVSALPRYVNLARLHPVLCVADTDGKCAKQLRSEWLPKIVPSRFSLRLAVVEAESWVLADPDALASFLKVPANRIPADPDAIVDPKLAVLNLAARSRDKLVRSEVVSSIDGSKPGAGYNIHLEEFARRHWNPRRAAQRSPSLARAVKRIQEVATGSS